MDLREKIKKCIACYGMLEEGDRVIVAVSGGIDSVVLLHLLVALRDEFALKLSVAHFNHGLRGRDSDRDEDFVKKLSKGYNLPLYVGRADNYSISDKGLSGQAYYRKIRYEFFSDVIRSFDADSVALAHHSDDQAETVLMRFILGSGMSGLKGMAPKRDDFIRPLFEVSREEIVSYAAEKGIDYVDDHTNKETKYLRNRVRLKLMPFLKEEFNPNIRETIVRSSMVIGREDDFLQGESEKAFYKSSITISDKEIRFSIDRLKNLHSAVQSRVLRMAWEHVADSSAGLYICHTEAVKRLLESDMPNKSLNLPMSVTVCREYGNMVFKLGRETPSHYEYELNINGFTEIPEAGMTLKADITEQIDALKLIDKDKGDNLACFDYDRVKGRLYLRPFRAGDRIIPYGMTGGKKVKDLYIDCKIPVSMRKINPLLLSDDGVLWVAGLKRSSKYPITRDTGKVLRIEIINRCV